MMMMLLALIPDASAISLKWWGAGPSVSTMLFPGQYPIAFPGGVRDDNDTTKVPKVGFDLNLAGRGVLYPSKNMRLAARLELGFGAGYGHQEFLLEYHPVLDNENSFQVIAGLGLGVGHERFKDTEEGDFLDVSYYPIRGSVGALLRDKYRAYELDLWGTYHIAGSQKYYSSSDAEPEDAKESVLGGAVYAGLGLEFTVWFGDFKTDTSNNNNNNNNNGNGKKEKNNKSGNGKKSS